MLSLRLKSKPAHTRLLMACVLLGLTVATVILSNAERSPSQPTSQSAPSILTFTTSTQPLKPTSLDAFIDATRLKRAQQDPWDPILQTRDCTQIKAALINHHVLASDVMFNVIREIKRCKPNQKTFILLAPDHFVQGGNNISTSLRPFEYKNASININTTQVNDLLTQVPHVEQRDDAFKIEHGVNAPLAMTTVLFDDIQLTPILIPVTLVNERTKPLAAWLKTQIDQGAFVLVSSDMSHYLNQDQALRNDQESLQALEKNQPAFFLKASDDHACNAKGIAILQLAMPQANWQETAHSISSEYGGSTRETTSYITGFWK